MVHASKDIEKGTDGEWTYAFLLPTHAPLQGVFATLTPRDFANEVPSVALCPHVRAHASRFPHPRHDRKGTTVASCSGTQTALGALHLAFVRIQCSKVLARFFCGVQWS